MTDVCTGECLGRETDVVASSVSLRIDRSLKFEGCLRQCHVSISPDDRPGDDHAFFIRYNK